MHLGRSLPPAAAPIGAREVISGICGIVRGQRELDRFQSELKEYFGVKHCFLVSSGKAAFALILLALKVLYPDRNEVLIPAFTCYSVPASITRAGLRIRLCDLHPDSLDFDFVRLSATLSQSSRPRQTDARLADGVASLPGETSDGGHRMYSIKRLLAVVPTHLFGFPSNVPRLRELIQDPGITIVEDAAQAMGETWEGRKLGTIGDISFFSLGRGKAFSVVEGGVILTNRDDLAEGLNGLISHLPRYGLLPLMLLICKAAALMMFMHPRLFWVPKNLSFLKLGETLFDPRFPILKMSAFQAGLARHWREKLEKLRDVRKTKVNQWIAKLEVRGNHGSSGFGGQALALLRFPLRIGDSKKREFLLSEGARRGLGIMPVYPRSINAITELKGKFDDRAFPVAEGYARKLVTLPTHGHLTDDDVAEIGRLVSSVLRNECSEVCE